jgi:hypothetical protein
LKGVEIATRITTYIACAIPIYLLVTEDTGIYYQWYWYAIGIVLLLLMASIPVLISTLLNLLICKVRGIIIR